MKIKTMHTEHCLALRLATPDKSFYITDDELARLVAAGSGTVKDMARTMVFEFGSITLFCPHSDGDPHQESIPCEAWRWYLNTNRFLQVLATIRLKKLETELDTNRFGSKGRAYPLLWLGELLRHPNVRNPEELVKALWYYRRRLKAELWPKFMDTLCRTLASARLYAHYRPGSSPEHEDAEFYFDGRFPGGMGFNGGVILHGADFGVHT